MLWCFQDYALIMILWCFHAYIMLWLWCMMIIIFMKLLCLCDYHAVVVIRFLYFITKYIVDSHPQYDVRCMMWYMGTRPWCDLFCDFMWWKEIMWWYGLAIDWIFLWMHVCIVLTYRVQGLCDSQVCDAKYDSIHILKKSLNCQVMIRWHVPIN